ncbi:MAG: biotin/lipoyl-containing protein, partial [Oscillospiraceae bacterium]
ISGTPVISPLVGTFFEAPSPEKPPFVTIGSKVKKGDVLFVVESMKLMNEIQSEIDGEIVAINVKNAQPVEYGQSIMVIK